MAGLTRGQSEKRHSGGGPEGGYGGGDGPGKAE